MTIQQLLHYTIENKASDLHLVVGAMPVVRIDGDLVPVAGEAVLNEAAVEPLILGTMSSETRDIFKVNKEVDYSFALEGSSRFRVNAYYQKSSPAASFRLIPSDIPAIDLLGLPAVCHQVTQLKQGFVLVTGPTGHGKSTTLAAIIEEINKTRPAHIVTVEDPIEYVYSSAKSIVSQREVHNDTHSWDIALRSILREDPDVVLIGEMRDLETITAALTIAETGHLVFATLHTNSASQTIDRIVDVFPEAAQPQIRMQLSGVLEVVISQRLVPRIGGGRVVTTEIMKGSSAIRTAVREGRTHMLDNIIMTSGEYGMQTLESSLGDLVRRQIITMETAQSFAVRPADLARFAKGATNL